MIKFYGYKKCSTSRKARKWFDDHQINYEFQDLVEDPPTKVDLANWLNTYQDRGLRYFFNTSGQHYRQMKLKYKIPTMTIEEAADLMSKDGKLIKRPLVVEENKLTCGFDEENYEKTWLSSTEN
ncbi:MAG: arsenate reductase family protein [Lactobacillus sp.]|nr:arsenate reductase family protein [Lactobacillus sp.]